MLTTVALTGSDQAVGGAGSVYRGFSVRETGGVAAATMKIYNGASATGTLLDTVSLNPGESRSEYYPEGISAQKGIYVDVGGTGTIEGSVRVI